MGVGCIPSPGSHPYHAPAQDTGRDAAVDAAKDLGQPVDAAHDASDATPEVDVATDVSVDAEVGDVDADAAAPDVCVPPSDEELCASANAVCGRVETTDVCGGVRDVQCGTCDGGQTCTIDNTCCTPQTNNDFCHMYAANCGLLDGRDNCGVQRTEIPCGTCNAGIDCNGTRCGECEAERDADFCARYGRDCNEFTAPDNCGDSRTVNCGSCNNGANCIAAGVCVCPGGSTELNCADGVDNDCDGLVDCLDPDCAGSRCGTGLDLRTCQSLQCRLL